MRPLFVFFVTILISLYFQWNIYPLKAMGVSFHETGFKYYSTLSDSRRIDTLIFKDTIRKDTLKKGVLDTVVLDSNAKIKRIVKLSGGMKIDSSFTDLIEYHAKDSVPSLVDPAVSEFYGDVVIKYQDFELNAAYVRWEKQKNILYARGNYNPKTKKYEGRPVFKTKDQGTAIADSIFYNMTSAKAKIYNPYSEQEGGFFSHGVTKKQNGNEAHLKDVIFSTCDLPDPHFGIHISKGIITDKQVITGPSYFEFEGLPLPLGVPFGFFPKPNRRASGIIFPQFGEDYTRGFMARDFGYYFGLSDYWDATLKGTIYTRGSYEAGVDSRYLKRYKYSGNVTFRYVYGRYGLEGTPEYAPQKDFNITWSHTQDANAHPGTTFSASVNAGTSSYLRNTAGGGTYNPQATLNNRLNSSVSYGRVLANGLMNLTVGLTHQQQITDKTISLSLPNVNFNVSSFSPFKGKNSIGDKWYEKINTSYSVQAMNTVSGKEAEVFKGGGLNLRKFNSTMIHSIPLSTNFNVLKYFNFNMSANYNESWYLQGLRPRFYRNSTNTADSSVLDTTVGFQRAGTYSLGGGVTTKIYNELTLKKGRLSKLRHVMTPMVNFSYSPNFNSLAYSQNRLAYYESGLMAGQPVIQNGQQVRYSTITGGQVSQSSENASINFSLDNTIEGKFRVKDTTGRDSTAVDGYIEKKVPIIQGLNFSTGYNFLAQSRKLANISFSGRTQLSQKFGISFNGGFSPYALEDYYDSNGQLISNEVDRYAWRTPDGKFQFKLPRLTNIGFSFQYSFNPDFFKKKNQAIDQQRNNSLNTATAEQMRQLNMISTDPNYFVDFSIPWNLSLSYNFSYSKFTTTNKNITNTVNFNGDVSLTTKWKVTYTSGYDFTNQKLTLPNLGIYRDLHCWDMSINWVPFGFYQSYSVDIKVKAPILQDLKLSKRRGWYTKF